MKTCDVCVCILGMRQVDGRMMKSRPANMCVCVRLDLGEMMEERTVNVCMYG